MKKGIHIFKHLLLTFPLCMSFFIVPVYADQDIYYPDPSSYTAYDYFLHYGYDELMLSDSNGTTYNVDLSNSGTNNGSISGTDSTTGTDHTTGTFNSASSTLGSKYMTCTTNNAISGTQTYSCYFSSSQSSVSNSQSININFNPNMSTSVSESTSVNETIKQNINTNITGSITGTETFNSYSRLPWLHGTYTHVSNFDSVYNYSFLDGHREFILAYYIRSISNSGIVNRAYGSPATNITYHTDISKLGGMTLVTTRVRLKNSVAEGQEHKTRFSIDLSFPVSYSNTDILPVFAGFSDMCPDDIAYLIGLRYPTGQLVDTGNKDTASHVDSATEASNTLGDKFSSYDEVESNMVSNMESSLGNISTDSDLIGNSNFLSSAVWVKQQFDRMTTNTPVGSVLGFSLILGLALIFIGKIR